MCSIGLFLALQTDVGLIPVSPLGCVFEKINYVQCKLHLTLQIRLKKKTKTHFKCNNGIREFYTFCMQSFK